MGQLVGYFDILGTTNKILRHRFSDAEILDFANPVGLMANVHPDFRFAVFSDCVVFSCKEIQVKEFIQVIRGLYLSWCSDFIFVRGGIALGEIKWVDFHYDKKLFSSLKNFAYARVYGKALVEAFELEKKSGPGVLCFVSEDAAKVIKKIIPGAVFQSLTPILNWIPSEKIGQMLNIFRDLSKTPLEEERRHFLATLYFLERLGTKK